MHPDQLDISAATVRRLVDEQFPAWAALPVTELAGQGTVHAIFRIGDRLAARFPLQDGEPAVTRSRLAAEAGAAHELLGRTPFPTPEPIALGEPGHGYPQPWSVQTWLPGTTAAEEDPSGSLEFALDLATFIRGVRSLDTRGRTFAGPGRGGDLRSHDGWVSTCLDASGELFDVPLLRRLWSELRRLPRRDDDVMTHGDLIPGNVLVRAHRLVGVIDVGGVGPADPALDLVAAWHLLRAGPRQVLREDLGCDDLSWARGRGWALEQALGVAWYYRTSNPVMSAMGRTTVQRILDDPASLYAEPVKG